jgi:hypothetical protein
MRWTAASASAGGSVVLDGIAVRGCLLVRHPGPLRGSVRGILPYTWFSEVGKTSELAALATLLQPVM